MIGKSYRSVRSFICGKAQIITKSVGTNHAEKEERNQDIRVIMGQPGRQNKSTQRCSSKQADNRILPGQNNSHKLAARVAKTALQSRISVYTNRQHPSPKLPGAPILRLDECRRLDSKTKSSKSPSRTARKRLSERRRNHIDIQKNRCIENTKNEKPLRHSQLISDYIITRKNSGFSTH